ncbi:MAG: hypothetical protein JXA72_04230 [Bacteroidales bacterium]|nr:hypothetical protein [Bacteroidales bacterium]
MKKGYKFLILLPAALLILFGYNGCKEDDDYDFSKIEPVIKVVTGAALPMQGRHYEFTATTRGGSTYAWESVLNAEVVTYPGAVGSWKTYIYFPDVISTDQDPEVISVTETTMGGIQSDPKTFQIDSVIPFTALPILGDTLVNAGFTSAFSANPSASDKIFSTYTWESTVGTITPDAAAPWKMSISFTNEDVGYTTISLIEQTSKGMIDTAELKVHILEYCALESGNEDLVGGWSGEDAYYDSEIVSSEADDKGVILKGVNAMFIFDFWGEEVTDEGDVKMTINEDGTVVIADQYLFTTLYDGASYEYWITKGKGRWNNCGEFPTLTFTYAVYNKTDDYTLPADYSSYFDGDVVFTANLVMDGGTPAVTKAYSEAMKLLTVKRPQIR